MESGDDGLLRSGPECRQGPLLAPVLDNDDSALAVGNYAGVSIHFGGRRLLGQHAAGDGVDDGKGLRHWQPSLPAGGMRPVGRPWGARGGYSQAISRLIPLALNWFPKPSCLLTASSAPSPRSP